jgi:hypothetical protein
VVGRRKRAAPRCKRNHLVHLKYLSISPRTRGVSEDRRY